MPGGLVGAGSRGVKQLPPGTTAAALYRPPSNAVSEQRIDGFTTGLDLTVAAPQDHAGRTSEPQPTLYFRSSAAITAPVEVSITNVDATEPDWKKTFHPPLAAGLHAVKLAGSKFHLKPGQVYAWSVTIVTDPAALADDLGATGYIERVTDHPAGTTATALAESGLWYDAFDAAVSHDPQLRDTLLAEVHLSSD